MSLSSRFRFALAAALLLPAGLPLSAATTGARVEMSIVDRDSGRSLPRYPHRGDVWVAGTPGHRYAVRLRNTGDRRVLVVLSVDGINAVTGQSADPMQAGYVLDAYQSTEIPGWRKSLDDIAQFVFADVGDSYAARTGRPRNVGAIGIAVFEEASPARYWHYRPATPAPARGREPAGDRAEAAGAAQSSADGTARQRIGTGHGQREWAPVAQTEFVRRSRVPSQVSQVRYDDLRRLLALGILPRPHPMRPDDGDRAPQAFPGGFVVDPPP